MSGMGYSEDSPSGATFGHGRAPWPGRHLGPARRAEGPHVRGARAGPSPSRYEFASLSSPRQTAMSGPGIKGLTVVGLVLGRTLRAGTAGGHHPKVRIRVES